MFPLPYGFVLMNDSSYLQGIPDLTILYYDKWATLEVKPKADAEQEPNQDWYVEKMDACSFSAFIYPENEEEVLYALQEALRPRRQARYT